MTFPVYLHAFGLRLHPHPVMELIGYTGGFQLYRYTRRRFPRSALPFEQNLWLIVGAIFGALVGSKVLAWIESFPDYWPHRLDPAAWIGGKTIVGGLLGGWAGVELAKKRLRISHSTGDAFVFPLIFGMAVGRIGCFLTGLEDHTCGIATTLPWGVNFGDGVYRHPAQLYDIAFLLALALALLVWNRKPHSNGQLFRLFMLEYLLWRLGVEFLKPRYTHLGLNAIQFACAGGAGYILIRYMVAKSYGGGVEPPVQDEPESICARTTG